MDTGEGLTAQEIQQQQFKTAWRGYAIADVEAFLSRVSETLNLLNTANASLKAELDHRQVELAEYKKREQLLKDTLINAQKVIEMMKANAQKEADIIIHEAELKAEKILQETFNRQARIKNDITELQQLKAGLQQELRQVLNRHLALLTEDPPPAA